MEVRWILLVHFYFGNILSLSSSEGIQIGQIGSAAGIIGSWTGSIHEEGSFH